MLIIQIGMLKLEEKEKEVFNHFIYHGVTNKDEHIYVHLCFKIPKSQMNDPKSDGIAIGGLV